MEFRSIPIPGKSTFQAYDIVVQISSQEDTPVSLLIRYQFEEEDFTYDPDVDYTKEPSKFGEIVFTDVIEYRFCYDEYTYDDFSDLAKAESEFYVAGNDFGLAEITESTYVENMVFKGVRSGWKIGMKPEERGAINESSLKHFRIWFDKYGRFDVLALGVLVRQYDD
jgi:hypothetical protein